MSKFGPIRTSVPIFGSQHIAKWDEKHRTVQHCPENHVDKPKHICGLMFLFRISLFCVASAYFGERSETCRSGLKSDYLCEMAYCGRNHFPIDYCRRIDARNLCSDIIQVISEWPNDLLSSVPTVHPLLTLR